MICYMFKLHIGIVPELGFLSDDKGRNGPQYLPKQNPAAPSDTQAIRTSSFFTQGPKLFNMLPIQLRDVPRPRDEAHAKKLFDKFKSRLDKWLEIIPDEPYTGKTLKTRPDPNSIEAQFEKHKVEIRRQWAVIFRKLEMEEAAQANTA